MLENKTGKDIASTVLPNGMVDLIVMKTISTNWEIVVRGIDTMSSQVIIAAQESLENGERTYSMDEQKTMQTFFEATLK